MSWTQLISTQLNSIPDTEASLNTGVYIQASLFRGVPKCRYGAAGAQPTRGGYGSKPGGYGSQATKPGGYAAQIALNTGVPYTGVNAYRRPLHKRP